jgi:hypothetical protein
MTDELKKTIENHKKMWTYIKEQEEVCGYAPNLNNRYGLKSNYIYISNIKDEPYNNCFLCEYAKNMSERFGSSGNMCDYCPCLWGSETETSAFYCEYYKEGCVIWSHSPAVDIINLPIKSELL